MGDPALRAAEVFPACEGTGIFSKDRQCWIAARRSVVTASNVAAVLGMHPFKSALELYVEMVTTQDEPEPEPGIDSPMFWGSALEEAILRAAAGFYGWEAVPGGELLISRRHTHLGATLDAIVRWEGSGWVPYEGKTTTIFQSKDWDEETDQAPDHVLIQAQTQLIVTGAPMDVVFCLIGGQRPVMVEVHADDELQALILEESEAFIDRVRRLDPPDPDHTAGATKALQKLYPQEDGSMVRLPSDALGWTRELAGIKAQQKALEKRESELKNLLRKSIGQATWGVLPESVENRRFWRWQLQERPEHITKASSSRVLRSMKNGPAVDPETLQLAAPPVRLVDELSQSLEAAEVSNVTPIARKRRRARR